VTCGNESCPWTGVTASEARTTAVATNGWA
jgi:hypothetical protein